MQVSSIYPMTDIAPYRDEALNDACKANNNRGFFSKMLNKNIIRHMNKDEQIQELIKISIDLKGKVFELTQKLESTEKVNKKVNSEV